MVNFFTYVCVHAQSLSDGWLFTTLWTVARQAPLSMEFSRQEYWSALPFPPPGNISHPGIESTSPAALAWADRFFTTVHLPVFVCKYVTKSLEATHSKPLININRINQWMGLDPRHCHSFHHSICFINSVSFIHSVSPSVKQCAWMVSAWNMPKKCRRDRQQTG